MTNYKLLRWFLPILSGVFLVLSYPPFSFIALPFLSLLPLFFFLNFTWPQKIVGGLKNSFLAGFLAGFIFLGGVMFWLFDTFPLNWIGIENNLFGFFLLLFPWLLLISILASFIGFFSLSYFFLSRKNFWDILLIPSLWVIFDYLRIWAFGLFLTGSESLLGPHWTFGSLAYTVAQNPSLRWIASFGGIYLVAFLIVLINVLIFFLVKKPSYFVFLALIILIFASFYFPQLPEMEKNQPLQIAILQTKFASYFFQTEEMAQEKFQTQSQLLTNVSRHYPGVEVVILPEGSNFLKQNNSKEVLTNLFDEKEILLIDSGKEKEGKFVGVFYSTQKGNLAQYEKILLVPYGDYLPFAFEPIAQIIDKKWVEKFKELRKKKKGEEIVICSTPNQYKISLHFCSEVVSPNLHRESARKGSQVFFNSGSLAFSGGSKSLDSQTQAMLQLRAAENGRYLVRATNYGSSYIINEKGEVIKKTPNFENQVLFGEVKPISKKTPYTRYGDWILILASLAVLTFLLVHGKFQNRKNKKKGGS